MRKSGEKFNSKDEGKKSVSDVKFSSELLLISFCKWPSFTPDFEKAVVFSEN